MTYNLKSPYWTPSIHAYDAEHLDCQINQNQINIVAEQSAKHAANNYNNNSALHSYMQASDHNNAGEYEEARRCGQMALACNICTIVKYAIAIVVVIILVIIYFAIGFSSAAASCDYQCTYNYAGQRVCTCVYY